MNVRERVDFVFLEEITASWLCEGRLYHVRLKHDFTVIFIQEFNIKKCVCIPY